MTNQTPKRPPRVKQPAPESPPAREEYPGPQTASTGEHIEPGQDLASPLPFNPNKAAEYDRGAAPAPPAGAFVSPVDPIVGASTVTELNPSAKVGSGGPTIGRNPTVGPLDRVRVDSTDRELTTNQGVAIADNQTSLKAGLRGPILLEDFILRKKITHFDHALIQLLLPVSLPGTSRPTPVAETRRELTERFRGLTAYLRSPAKGLWTAPDGHTERDDVVMVEIVTEAFDRIWWRAYATTLAERFQQESIHVRAMAVELLDEAAR
jgi:hypothetical protein